MKNAQTSIRHKLLNRFNHSSALRAIFCSLWIGCATSCFATYFSIPVGTITDHSNPAITNSLAWYMATYGAGHHYQLSSSANYVINDSLTIPANAYLEPVAGATPVIYAGAGCDGEAMLHMSTHSTLQNIECYGAWRAAAIVTADNIDYPTISHCTLYATKNNYSDPNGRPDIIRLSECNNINILDSVIQNAGYPKADGYENVAFYSRGIYLVRCGVKSNLNRNSIGGILGANIGLIACTNVDIISNQIFNCGMAAGYGTTGTEDGVTSYHQSTGNTVMNVNIKLNHFHHYYNHAIHVSGRGFYIEDNIFDLPPTTHSVIYLGDQYGTDCTKNCTIKNNDFAACNGAISLNYYQPSTVTVSGNSCNTTGGPKNQCN